MYEGRKFEATHEEVLLLPYVCAWCRYECDAEVHTWGRGQGHSPFFLDDSGAQDRARENAWAAAGRNARSVLRFARCPRCNQRSRWHILWFLLSSGLAVLLPGLLFAAFGSWLYGRREELMGLVLILSGLISSGAIYWYWIHPKWARASQRVRFVRPGHGDS